MIALWMTLLLAQEGPLKADTDKKCLECHGEQGEDWKPSIHAANSIGCTACHGTDQIDPKKPVPHLFQETFIKGFKGKLKTQGYRSQSPDLCKKCHETVFEAFKESTHYEQTTDVDEGAKQEVKGCISCHEWHKTVKADVTSIVANACSKCHKPTSMQMNRGHLYVEASENLKKFLADLSSKFQQPGISWRKEEMAYTEGNGLLRLSAVKQHHATKKNLTELTNGLTSAANQAKAAYSTLEGREREFGRRHVGLAIFLGLMAVNAGLVAVWGKRRRSAA